MVGNYEIPPFCEEIDNSEIYERVVETLKSDQIVYIYVIVFSFSEMIILLPFGIVNKWHECMYQNSTHIVPKFRVPYRLVCQAGGLWVAPVTVGLILSISIAS